ncbi:ATP-binding protein [Nonomuraea sp. NPDC048916]|uniref:ATP-binding protein n=1 Tax=Nonomuraea sp. NPDC048916 TaxID=3154232 RepID=UPI0033F87E11
MNTDSGDAAPPSLLVTFFAESSLADTRAAAQHHAREQGLTGERLEDFVMAVNECLVNVLAHGGGQGRLRLWREGDTLLCEVRDSGPGIPSRFLDESELPAPSQLGGRGIWLIRRLTDGAVFATGSAGTTVLIAKKLTAGKPVPGQPAAGKLATGKVPTGNPAAGTPPGDAGEPFRPAGGSADRA